MNSGTRLGPLFLLFAIGGAVACMVSSHKKPQPSDPMRDGLLAMLARGLYQQNFHDCGVAMIALSRGFSDQRSVQECLYTAMDDVVERFGDMQAFSLFRQMAKHAGHAEFARSLHAIADDITTLDRQEFQREAQVARRVRQVLHSAGMMQSRLYPEPGNDDEHMPRAAVYVSGNEMTPAEFMNRHKSTARLLAAPVCVHQ
jgi:hypothetical protein